MTKITDKHLLNKFNREFDSIAEALIDITEIEVEMQINEKTALADTQKSHLSVTGRANDVGIDTILEGEGVPVQVDNGEDG